MAQIFHILERKNWENAQKKGEYRPDSLETDGFIHFSNADQLLKVANSFYKNQKNLVVLRVESNALEATLKVEPPLEAPLSGVLFPHLYGALNLDAVEDVFDFPCGEDGLFQLPDNMMTGNL